MKKNDKIVILLGAGAMVESTDTSTKSLTGKVVNACESYNICKPLIHEICKEFSQLYRSEEEINFEDIFNIAELLYGYKSKNEIKRYIPQERIFLELKSFFSENVTPCCIRDMQEIIISTINNEVHKYDTEISAKGELFKNFFSKLEDESNSYLDVFNLNYDTWVEQSLSDYTDGYVEDSNSRYKNIMLQFDAPSYLQQHRNRVSHLHGQIYFEFPRFDENDEDSKKINFEEPFDTLWKYKSYEEAKNVRENVVRSGDNSQSGNYIRKSNIITGMMKLDKVLWHPLDMYLGEFIHALIHHKKLIIIGYGFFDLYINRLLEMFNSVHLNDRKIVLIDYVPEDSLSSLAEHPFTSSGSKAIFSNLMFQDDFWWDKRKNSLKSDAMQVSEDEQGLIFIKGFHQACQEIDKIISFLQC